MSVPIIDIDLFKAFNDRYGHPAGDDCLRRVSAVFENHAKRSGDLVARIGGEEFAIIMAGNNQVDSEKHALNLINEIKQLSIVHEGSTVNDVVTISIGMAATIPSTDGSADEFIQQADKALYQAKDSGRNQLCLWRVGESYSI